MLIPPSLELVGLSVLSLADVNMFRLTGMCVSFIRKKCFVPVHLHCTAISFKLCACGSYIFNLFNYYVYVCSAGDLKMSFPLYRFFFRSAVFSPIPTPI
jgi:hypothetical protein